MSHRCVRHGALALALLLGAGSLAAQAGPPQMAVPLESPAASVSQTVGLTEIAVTYHRPAVKGRKIWGELVPLDTVWRAGANQNTVLEVSTAFTVGGTRLPAGRYGLHLLPGASRWTFIISKQANAWGAFSYAQSEDAARVTVTPRAADFLERLAYTMDEPTDSTVQLTLHWEKLAASLPITVATTQVVMDSLRQQLRGLVRFWPTGWAESARWALAHNGDLALAYAWADSASQIAPTFANLRLKATAMERRGDRAGAEALRQQSMATATEADINALAYQLLAQGKRDEAIAMFRQNVKDYPRSWNVYDSLGEALAQAGNKKEALANYQKALDLAPEGQKARIRTAMVPLR